MKHIHTSITKVATIVGMVGLSVSVLAAEQIKESYHPQVNGSPVTLIKDNLITQKLGGRLVNLDVWAGEFIRHDDNIFGQADNQVSDTIYTTAVGFHMQAEDKDRWKVVTTGQLQRNHYSSNHEYSGFEGFFHSQGSIDFSPALSARFVANVDKTYDNVRGERDIFGLTQYAVGVGTSVRPSPFFALDLDYRFYAQRRESGYLEYQQYDEHTVSARPVYAITPNTSIYTQLTYAKALPKMGDLSGVTKNLGDYGRNFTDTESLTWVAGFGWRLREDAKFYGEAGLIHMSFGDNGLTAADPSGSTTRPNVRIGGDIALNSDWKVGFETAYTTTVSAVTTNAATSKYIRSLRLVSKVTYSPGAGRFTTIVTPYYAKNRPSYNTNYTELGIGIGATYCIKDWVNVSAGYRYARVEYADGVEYGRNTATLGVAITF